MTRLGALFAHAYRWTLAPVLESLAGGVPGARRCKYHPSCSRYAIEAAERYGIARGAALAAWRLLRCNPWSHGGVDRVQDQRLFRGRLASTRRVSRPA
jgi:putative membrane protein insertion efficiency factor